MLHVGAGEACGSTQLKETRLLAPCYGKRPCKTGFYLLELGACPEEESPFETVQLRLPDSLARLLYDIGRLVERIQPA